MSAIKKLASLRPRDEDDYCHFLRWRISRPLVHRIFLLLFGLSAVYLLLTLPAGLRGRMKGYPVYRYDSAGLRFYKGKAEIRARSGYTAYVGDVEKGIAKGAGSLYNREGRKVYQGEFDNNRYEGQGTQYWQNGSRQYEGAFENGMRSGEGILYNERGSEVFAGRFQSDAPLYEELVGKKLNGDWVSTGVYVLRSDLPSGEEKLEAPEQLEEHFDNLCYEGSTYLAAGEAASIFCLRQSTGEEIFQDMQEAELVERLEDVFEITDYEEDYEIYIRTYEKSGMQYTFFYEEPEGRFYFYYIS